jgi:recombination protein U
MVNARYAAQGLAFVFKVPEAWRCLGRTEKGFLCVPVPGVVDFIGIARGKPVAFDCKEVSKGLRFPFSKLPEHQYRFLENWRSQGGAAFLLVAFWQSGRIGLLNIDDFADAYRAWQKGKGKASVAFRAFVPISGADWLISLMFSE